MMTRLTLDTTGIKSPLDIGNPSPAKPAPVERAEPARRKTAKVGAGESRSRPPRRSRPATDATTSASAATPRPSAPFYGGGRPIQTSLALEAELATRVEELSRAGAVTFSALLVAVLQNGLPTTADQALRAAIHERADHPRGARVERNVRLPEQLRVRLDELTANVRDAARRATRADLTNAVLRSALPEDAEGAAKLVSDHRRRVELLALAA
jgi:hypothetical protein